MRKKWKVKKGWIKVVVMGDSKGNIVDVRVGNEDLNEGSSSRGMIRKNKKKVKKLLGDGLHDCKDTFNLCDKLNVDPVIKIRKNASRKARGSRLRKNKVEEYFKLGHKKWVKKTGYGLRWPLHRRNILFCEENIWRMCKKHKEKKYVS